MPAPPEFITRFSEKLSLAVAPILHEMWDLCEKETRDKIAGDIVRRLTTGELMANVGPVEMHPARAASRAGLGLAESSSDTAQMELAQMSPQKRGAQNRAPKGRIKGAVAEIIAKAPDDGMTRSELRDEATKLLGAPIKEGSLKQALRLLREGGHIENRDLRWYPLKKAGTEEQT